jgi:hypothetical protein
VTATVERHAPVIVDVTLHDARTGKAETLTCTPEHPLYVQGQGFVEAGSLGIGTSIVSRAGPALQVTDLTWEKNKAQELASAGGLGGYTVYNLTVDGDHTFFVGTANGGTWVHNKCAGFHHFVPRALGSKVPYGSNLLTYLNAADHTAVHAALSDFLRDEKTLDASGATVNMLPGPGNSGAVIQGNFSTLQRQAALGAFYQKYQGGKYFQAFQDEFNATVAGGWWH